jgi:hypothetical protein
MGGNTGDLPSAETYFRLFKDGEQGFFNIKGATDTNFFLFALPIYAWTKGFASGPVCIP